MQTKQLTDFVYSLCYGDLPPKAVDLGKKSVEDLIGVAIAGSDSRQGDIWRSYFTKQPQPQEASAWDRSFHSNQAMQTAALNAAYAHLLEMDDVHTTSIVHLGAVTIPTALALGQQLHRSGEEVLVAIAAGYEMGARVGEAITPGSYYFWHTTGIVGGLAAAITAGKLLRLNRTQLLNAIGSAGTQAAGLWEFLEDGAMSKALHTANATLCGIRSAELAALGLTGASRILEGDRGLLRALTPDYDLEALTRQMEPTKLKIQENSFKPYACCRHIHSAIYAAECLKKEHHFEPNDILKIIDATYHLAVQTVDSPTPVTPYACKFSAQYCIAAMITDGSLLDAAFSPSAVGNPATRALMTRISVRADETLNAQHLDNPSCWPHLLEIYLRTGEVLCQQVDFPPGDFMNPFNWDAVDRKFYALTHNIIPSARAAALCKNIHILDGLVDINAIFDDHMSVDGRYLETGLM